MSGAQGRCLNFIMAGRCSPTGIAGGILRIASFIKSEEQHISVIPMDSHTAFYFPPASKDRAVNSMEIKDFIILWTYSQ